MKMIRSLDTSRLRLQLRWTLGTNAQKEKAVVWKNMKYVKTCLKALQTVQAISFDAFVLSFLQRKKYRSMNRVDDKLTNKIDIALPQKQTIYPRRPSLRAGIQAINKFQLVLFFCAISIQVSAKTTLHNHAPLGSLAVVSMPVSQVTDSFTKNIFATIDETFGKVGFDAYQILHFKKTYLYLIFLEKLFQVQKNPAFAKYKNDFADFLYDNKQSLPHIPTAALVTSAGWNGVTITAQDLQNSTAWQLYCKNMICDLYVYFSMVLQVIHNVEKQTFNYIPHFETSFYNADYTDLRTLNEMARTRLVLEENLKQRWLDQSVVWKNLPSGSSQRKNTTKSVLTLESEVVAFRKTKFYQTIHNAHAALGVKPNESISNQHLLAASRLASPLKEQMFCYYLLYEASGQMTSFLHANNLKNTLEICGAAKIIPNIFPYRSSDFIVLDELLNIKSKAEGTHVNSIHPSPKQYKIDEIRKPEVLQQTYRNGAREVDQHLAHMHELQVQAQSFWSDLGHDFSHAWSDVKHAVEAGGNAIKNSVLAAEHGIVGIGATIVGGLAAMGGDDKILKWGSQQFKDEEASFNAESTDLSNEVDDFTASLKDGIVAPVAEIGGTLQGYILDDQKLGQDTASIIASVSDAILNFGAKLTSATSLASRGMEQVVVQAAEITSEVAVVLVDAAWAIFSKKGQDEFLDQGQELGKQCMMAIAQAYNCAKGATTSTISSALTGMGIIINAITTLFIDLSREITYLFTGGIFNVLHLSSIPGLSKAASYAAQQRDHVTNVLSAHRSTINIVMGVVACIAVDAVVDVGTGGAGTVADAEIDAAIMGEETGAEAVEATETAANEARAAAAAAQNTVKEAAQKVATLTKEGASQAELTAARLSLNQAKLAEFAANSSAKVAENLAKGVAKKVAEDAAKNVATDVSTTTAKSFAQRLAVQAQEKVSSVIQKAKSLGQSLSNLAKSNQAIAEAAAKDLTEKEVTLADAQAALASATEDGKAAAQAEVDAAQAQVDQAETVAQEARSIADETKTGKAVRYGKNTLKVLGEALKPVGMMMNVIFNLGSMIGGYNQDAQNALNMQTQAQALQKVWSFSNANKVSTAETQFAFVDEMDQKIQAQVGNQTLGVTLAQNITNANILNLRQSLAKLLAPLYANLLTPNPATNLLLANIATSWNLESQYFNLYPSQGFFTTTTGRPDFAYAQEIAQAPQVTNLLLSSSATAVKPDKLWFNQRCMACDNLTPEGTLKKPLDPLTVQIDLQFLYTLNSVFYAGLYLGGNYANYGALNYVVPFLKGVTLQQAQAAYFAGTAPGLVQAQVDPSIVDFDQTHLAKMVVLYRQSATSPIMLGVYENEGLGWIVQSKLPGSAQLDHAHVFTVQATLNQTQLILKLFVDGGDQPIFEQTVQVTALQNQRMFGVICSGAAIEWNQITPQSKIVTTARQKNTTITSEIEREKQNKLTLGLVLNPKFGSFALKPLSKQAILLGQYVYGTMETDVKKILPNSPIDFVVFAVNKPGSDLQLGLNPQVALQNPNVVIVSLINGTMYNQEGKTVGNVANVWTEFQTSVGPFAEKFTNFITEQQTSINQGLANIKFGNFNLDVINAQALNSGQYIYTGSQTLCNANGTVMLDATTKKPMLDYLVCANYTPTNLIIGMPPTASNANALLSFVTGNVYVKTTVISATAAPAFVSSVNQYQQLGAYATQFGIVSTDPMFTTIQAAQTAYASYVPPLQKPAMPVVVAQRIVAQPGHFTKGVHLVFGPPRAPGVHLDFKGLDLAKRQKDAAGSVGYQLSAGGKKMKNAKQT
jgi:hypothetical protein